MAFIWLVHLGSCKMRQNKVEEGGGLSLHADAICRGDLGFRGLISTELQRVLLRTVVQYLALSQDPTSFSCEEKGLLATDQYQ